MLRIAGVRQADMKGYSFAREDVNARALANAYAQTLGQVFTHEMKPYEVEILVAQVGETQDRRRAVPHPLRRHGHGRAGLLGPRRPGRRHHRGRPRALPDRRSTAAARSASAPSVLANDGEPLAAAQLEVAFLDRARTRRAFQRVRGDDLAAILTEGTKA